MIVDRKWEIGNRSFPIGWSEKWVTAPKIAALLGRRSSPTGFSSFVGEPKAHGQLSRITGAKSVVSIVLRVGRTVRWDRLSVRAREAAIAKKWPSTAVRTVLLGLLLSLPGCQGSSELTDPKARALVRQLSSDNAKVRLKAVVALRYLEPPPKAAIPAITEALKDQNAKVRYHAAMTLATMAIRDRTATTGLLEALKDENLDVRAWAAKGLGRSGQRTPQVAAALIRVLKHEKWCYVRGAAASALGKIGVVSEDVVPALSDALDDADPNVRSDAADALGEIGPAAKQGVPALVAALRINRWLNVRRSTVEALGAIGSASGDAVPALIEALTDDDGIVRDESARALGGMGSAAKSAVPALLEALRKETDNDGRRSIIVGLGDIGPGATEAVPALTEALKDKDEETRAAAAEALKKIKGAAPKR